MADERRYSAADVPVTAEEVAHRGFSTTFRGFHPDEVRIYLTRVSESLRAARDRQRELEQQVRDLENRKPHLDEATLTAALGEHTARIIRSAHEAAADIRAKAEESVEQILKDAHEEAAKLRAEAERALADRTTEADAEANAVRQAAEADALGVRRRAQEQADRLLERARAQSKDMANEVQGLRNRVMGDLMRRRRVALMQVEQLQAGRDQLLEAYRVVRRTLDEATDSLERAESDARAAAEAAAHRVAAEPEPTPDELVADETGATHSAAAAIESVQIGEAPPPPPPPPPPARQPEPEPANVEPAPVFSRPPDSMSSVRLVRDSDVAGSADDDAPAEPVRPTLKVVQPPSEVESVRVFRGNAPAPDEPELPAPAAAPDPQPEPAPVAEAPAPNPQVDELFAKIRAEQDEPEPEPERAPEPAAEAAPEPEAQPEPDNEELLVARRDEALAPISSALLRKLKRAMQDEQNEVLDRLRRHRSGRMSLEVAFPEDVDQAARYRAAAAQPLLDAMNAGGTSAGANGNRSTDGVDDIAAELADAIAGPLARRLAQALSEAASAGEDETAITERVSAIYRDIKGARLERIAADHAGSAYMAGAFVTWAPGTPLRWIVHDVDGQCPDCDDNALAGPTPRGEAFPTGQVRPPAHAGCRCLLTPATA